ncbi:MAG: bifunctional riboflavin kinase/FAD synthetase [Rhodospirillales bacterium]|nr:bifunctional riboflavin kinase/FAD synthetase [Rhodospirillales bacterium]
MRIFRHFEALPAECRGAVVAIGNFDGVHRGHKAVIGEAGSLARAAGVPWAVLTFEPHPRTVFRPADEPFRLTPFRAKAHHIEEMGADILIVQHFDKEFSLRSAEDFVTEVLVEGLAAHHVVSGYDFVFGHGRGGDCDLLLHMGKEKGFGFTAVQAVVDEHGDVYSSTRVRDCLRNADPKAAARILGRPFEIDGRVEHGDKRGRTIGWPTANLYLDEFLRPARGGYVIRAGIDKGAATVWHDGIANLGIRPTFEKSDLVLEVHLFDFNGDLYGQHLRVQFIDFLRPEIKFDSVEALIARIEADVITARRILSEA